MFFCPGIVLKEDSNYIFYILNKSCATFNSLNWKEYYKVLDLVVFFHSVTLWCIKMASEIQSFLSQALWQQALIYYVTVLKSPRRNTISVRESRIIMKGIIFKKWSLVVILIKSKKIVIYVRREVVKKKREEREALKYWNFFGTPQDLILCCTCIRM